MRRLPSFALALCILPLAACGAAQKEQSHKKKFQPTQTTGASSVWACPDTGLRWFTFVDSSNQDRPWQPPSRLKPDPKAAPVILPSLHLNYAYQDQTGKAQVGSQEILEPNLSWVDDINSDGQADLAIHDGIRETRPTWVLLNCGRDRYALAYEGMLEGVAVEEHPDPASKWKALRIHWWYVQGEHQQNSILHWDGSKFTKACEYRVHADSLALPRRSGCP